MGSFRASLEASIVLDKAGVITHVNPAAERLLRVAAQEIIGKPLVDVMLPPTHRSPDNANFTSDLASGRASGRRQELVAQQRWPPVSARSDCWRVQERPGDRLHRQCARHIGASQAARSCASARNCPRCVGQIGAAQYTHSNKSAVSRSAAGGARAAQGPALSL